MIFYTVYRTQNTVNGKYYFGVHKTLNPYDGYLGSGKILKSAVEKYGEQSFIKNVCFIFDTPEKAFAKEFELIDTYRGDPLCYNLRQGGSGGFDYINQRPNQEWRVEACKKAAAVLNGKLKTDADVNRRWRKAQQSHWKQFNDRYKLNGNKAASDAWRGSFHTEKTRGLMRLKKLGVKTGRVWVYHSEQQSCKSVSSDSLSLWLQLGWLKGRKKYAA